MDNEEQFYNTTTDRVAWAKKLDDIRNNFPDRQPAGTLEVVSEDVAFWLANQIGATGFLLGPQGYWDSRVVEARSFRFNSIDELEDFAHQIKASSLTALPYMLLEMCPKLATRKVNTTTFEIIDLPKPEKPPGHLVLRIGFLGENDHDVNQVLSSLAAG